jgi:branched-chain amino acid transport system ATP-binding protein
MSTSLRCTSSAIAGSDCSPVASSRCWRAFALVRRPRLLLVDELSLGLAPIVVQRLLPVVRQYAIETGAAALLVEQHVELALDVSDRGIAMSHGEIALEGKASDLRHDRAVLLSSYLGGSGQSFAARRRR